MSENERVTVCCASKDYDFDEVAFDPIGRSDVFVTLNTIAHCCWYERSGVSDHTFWIMLTTNVQTRTNFARTPT